MEDCLFCKIIKKEIPSDVIHEDKEFIVFKDINPKAPVHILLVPKKHIKSVNEIKEEDKEMVGELFLLSQKIAEKVKVKDTGYKLVFNVGRGGGQLIDHLHLHLIGGWDSPKERDIPGMP
jgi:histidine triad (HIT) family protein